MVIIVCVVYVLEAHLVRHVKDDDDPKGSPVAGGKDRSVSLLTTGIPHLNLHFFIVDDCLTGADVHSNGGNEVVCAGVVEEFIEEAGFSNTRIPYLKIKEMHQNE